MARRPNDFYATPEWASRALCSRVPISGRVLECCAGSGALLPALIESPRVVRVQTNDIDPLRQCDYSEDVSLSSSWARLPSVEWIVTNPPFNVAAQIVPHALAHARFGIAMLLRLSYLEPCENRGLWLAENPLSKLIVLERTFCNCT
ncbi:MAG: hypothetical protein QOH63_1941 [Acidobacteriota bacterium]|jgi:tRNA1(Val) A37 N6-methylase TrmN6|nr:hypothetical protein [Acidobacteriota bacterium]